MPRFALLLLPIAGCVGLSLALAETPVTTTAADTSALDVSDAAVEDRLLGDLKYLSDDKLQGRGVGLEGLDEAAEFIRGEFEAVGLDVTRVDGGAFQPFEMTTGSELLDGNTLTLTSAEGMKVPLKLDEDFVVASFGTPGEVVGPLAFVGYGIDAEKKGYSDFKGVDVKDKVVLIMRRVPRQGRDDGPFTGPHGRLGRESSLTSKASNAFRRGAKAVLFVNDEYSLQEKLDKSISGMKKSIAATEKELAELKADDTDARSRLETELATDRKRLAELEATDPTDELMSFGYGGNVGAQKLPIGQITRDVADKVLTAAGLGTLSGIEKAIDETLEPRSAVLEGWQAEGEFKTERVEATVKNVIGVLEGEGPLKDEVIVIGAHYDHVGMGGAGSLLPGSKAVHNGADDNASGTVALIELARQLAKDGKRYPRTLVFIAFTAEESGLRGSAFYTKNPLLPLEKTIAMFNMDMVGRLREVMTVFGTGTATHFESLVQEVAKKNDVKAVMKPEGFGPSDHSSFYAKKIPVLHLFTGTHADYHKPSDDWDKVNIDGIQKAVDMLEEIVVTTAETAARPEYVEVKGRANVARAGSRPYFGSIPDFGTEEPGYAISGVAPGSPADQGGLKGGDRIVMLGKDKIGSLDDFDLALRKYDPNEKVAVEVMRDGKRVKLTVKLGEPRG